MMGQTSGTRTITFDFYGTLVQWHEAVEAAFRAIVTRHGTTAAYYAHASVGCLHIRPLVAIHEKSDRAIMVSIAPPHTPSMIAMP